VQFAVEVKQVHRKFKNKSNYLQNTIVKEIREFMA